MRNSNRVSLKGKTKSKDISREEVRGKLARYCSYQERTERQVFQKLVSLGAPAEWHEEMTTFLKEEGYLNESRFAESLIRGKINGRGWGPQKIAMKLRMEGIFTPNNEQKLKKADYSVAERKMMAALIRKKENLVSKGDDHWKIKLLRFCYSRGFDSEKAMEMIGNLGKI